MLSVLSVLCTKHGWRRLRIPAPLRRHVSSDPFGLENVGSSSAQVDVVFVMPFFGIIIRNMEETVNLLNPSRRTRNRLSYDLALFCPPVWIVNHWFPFFFGLMEALFLRGGYVAPTTGRILAFQVNRSTGLIWGLFWINWIIVNCVWVSLASLGTCLPYWYVIL